MGNKVAKSSLTGVFQEFEHISGRMLIEAITLNDPEKTQAAIYKAKSEFVKPVRSNSNLAEYDDMIEYMIKYLTKPYDVGDGPFFTKTPLQLCEAKCTKKAEAVIKQNLASLHQGAGPVQNVISPTVGTVSKDRVALAKERLKEIRSHGTKPSLQP